MTPLEEEDLKRPDRVPDRVPKVGDLVKIKSRAWYAKWGRKLIFSLGIMPPMAIYCGDVMKVRQVDDSGKTTCFYLEEDPTHWCWPLAAFEDVYPADSVTKVSKSTFDGYYSLAKQAIENCCGVSVSTGESPSDGITVSYNAYKTGDIVAKEPAVPIHIEDKTSTSGHPKDTPLKLVDINPIKLKKV